MRRHPSPSPTTATLLFAGLLLAAQIVAGCAADGVDELPPDELVPGQEATLAGAPVRLGDAEALVTAALGAPSQRRDLGDLGVRATWTAHNLDLRFSPDLVQIRLHAGATARTAAGLTIGSTRADVTAALGEAVQDGILDTSWYPHHGIAFEWTSDTVDAILLFAPTND